MKCLHCNREYNDEYDFCPFCAEPKPKPEPTVEDLVNEQESNRKSVYLSLPIFMWIPMYIVIYIIAIVSNLPDLGEIIQWDKVVPNAGTVAFWNTVLVIGASILGYYDDKNKTPREKQISAQFAHDDTSICPRCGSHDIALGSKGYDWNKAWWGEVIGNDAAKYDAGAESRRVTAHCKHCGNDWLTDREWIN